MRYGRYLAVVLVALGVWQLAAQTAPGTTGVDAKLVAKLEATVDDFGGLARYSEANQALAAHEPGRVVFMGDSITDAWGRRVSTFFPGKPYVNRGISGQTTPQMLVRFRQDVLDLHPETVVVLAGTNDIAGNTGPSTLEMIEGNLQSMAELSRGNHIRVVLASVTPVAKYPWRPEIADPAGKIRTLNAWIKHYCEQTGCTYLDYWTALAGPDGGMKPGISFDGVHPNDKGYAMMAPLALKALAQ